MMDAALQRIIDNEIVDKVISLYRPDIDDETKKDVRQEIFLMLLEMMETQKYKEIEDKFSYLYFAVKKQVNSDSSMIYRKYFHTKHAFETNIGFGTLLSNNDEENDEKDD